MTESEIENDQNDLDHDDHGEPAHARQLMRSWGSVLLIIFYVENLDVGSWGVKNDV